MKRKDYQVDDCVIGPLGHGRVVAVHNSDDDAQLGPATLMRRTGIWVRYESRSWDFLDPRTKGFDDVFGDYEGLPLGSIFHGRVSVFSKPSFWGYCAQCDEYDYFLERVDYLCAACRFSEEFPEG